MAQYSNLGHTDCFKAAQAACRCWGGGAQHIEGILLEAMDLAYWFDSLQRFTSSFLRPVLQPLLRLLHCFFSLRPSPGAPSYQLALTALTLVSQFMKSLKKGNFDHT